MGLKKFSIWGKILEKEKPQAPPGKNEKESLFDLLIHDLTAPLSIISTSTNNILHKGERYGPLTDHQKNILERVLRNAHKAQTLLQEMIEIFRSEEGYFKGEFFSIENTIRESLIDVLEITTPQVGERLCKAENQEELLRILETQGIFVEIMGKYCHSHFCHDQKKIHQILRNLISNAQKYRRSKTKISISGESDLLISVEDDGAGIPHEEQEMIFKRFVRRNEDQQSNVPGLGLGLTGVKALVEAMKGQIHLESTTGIGTRFVVQIPPLQS